MQKQHSLAIKIGKLVLAVGVIYAAHQVVFTHAWGDHQFYFSGVNIILPVLYTLLGSVGSALLVLGCGVAKMLGLAASLPFANLTWGIPTQLALLVWRFRDHRVGAIILNVLIPLISIIFFITHPGVGVGFWYASFWLIPMVLQIMPHHFIFKTAVQATFVAHAVGSIIWLYTVPMTPHRWLLLMPVVCVERGVYALCSGLLFALIQKNKNPSLSLLDNRVRV